MVNLYLVRSGGRSKALVSYQPFPLYTILGGVFLDVVECIYLLPIRNFRSRSHFESVQLRRTLSKFSFLLFFS